MKIRNDKSKTIIFLFISLIFMGIGFAILQSNLNISGTATASGSFNIEIIGVTPTATSTYTKHEATLSPVFEKPGDSVQYNVQVQNKGTIDAQIKAELDSSDNIKDSNDNDIYLFDIEYENGKKATSWPFYDLDAGLTTTIKITITYNPDAEEFPNRTVDFELTLDARQKSSTEAMQDYQEFTDNIDFELDTNGNIISYNKNSSKVIKDGYITVGATNYEGKAIRGITSSSFIENSGNVTLFTEDGSTLSIYIDYPKGSNEYNSVKAVLASVGYEDEAEAQGTKSDLTNLELKKMEIKSNSILTKTATTYVKMYGKGDIDMPSNPIFMVNINLQTGAISEASVTMYVGKLDLTNASNLETIGNNAFKNANLDDIRFPQNGRLTSLGSEAFKGTKLETVTLPNTVTSIGESVFEGSQLSSIILSTGITSIPNNAFSSCQLEGEIIIPAGVTSIGNYAFSAGNSYGNATNKIETITFENNSQLTTIGNYAFAYNQLSGTLTIPNSVTSIGEAAFASRDSTPQTINTLILGTGLMTVGNYAFRYTTTTNLIMPQYVSTVVSSFKYKFTGVVNLTIQSGVIPDNAFYINNSSILNNTTRSLTIGSGVTSIGSNAFRGNDLQNLTTLIFENNSQLQTIGDNAFYYNQLSGTLTIPNSVTTIGNSAFRYNQLSGALTILSGLTNIGDSAFEYNQITSLTIPSNVTSIGDSAFFGNQISTLDLSNASGLHTIGNGVFCSNQLSSLTIPSYVTSIGNYAFCDNQISTINLNNDTNLTTIGEQAFEDNQLSGTLTIPNSVTSIGEAAFASRDSTPQTINTLILGTGLMTVGNYAFRYTTTTNLIMPQYVSGVASSFNTKYTGVVNLTIQSGVIPERAFDSMLNTTTTTITLGSGVTSVGDYAFHVNLNISPHSTLTTLIIENNSQLQSIGDNAFSGNQISGEFVFSPNLTTIGDYAFSGNQISGTLIIPSSVTSIGPGAFSNNQISSLDLSNATGIQEIEALAFHSNQISSLTIPSHIRRIKQSAFSHEGAGNKTKISTLVFEGNSQLQTIDNTAFQDNAISSLTIPNSVTIIGQDVFRGNPISGTLTIPDSVTTIGSHAFLGNSINILNIGSGLTSLGSYAFRNSNVSTTGTITNININMTQAEWNSRNLPASGWYDSNAIITYNSQ